MVFHFKLKSREIRFDKGRNSVLSQKNVVGVHIRQAWVKIQTCGELIISNILNGTLNPSKQT